MSLGVLKEWLGEGGAAVDRRIAEHRATICRECPENRHPKWWEHTKHAIAEVIRMHLEVKNRTHIAVEDETNLHMCRVCGCCIPLKIHVPLKHILANTEPEMLAKFPLACWIPNETKANS